MISDLIARIDSAVQLGDPAAITGRIKRELNLLLGSGLIEEKSYTPY